MIINALADGKKKGMSRTSLLKKCKVDSSGRFSQSLLELEMSGFILKYDAYRGKSKEILYRIVDEFCLFYLKFMKPFKGSRWLQLYQKPAYSIWCGYAFEGICLKHANEIKRVLKIEGVVSKNYAWHNEKAQIDLVIDRDDKWINLIEAKFYNEAYEMDESYYKKLEAKKAEFKKYKAGKKGVFISMITTQGVEENKYSTAILDHNLTTDCLF
jgi:hypothetical protein